MTRDVTKIKRRDEKQYFTTVGIISIVVKGTLIQVPFSTPIVFTHELTRRLYKNNFNWWEGVRKSRMEKSNEFK